MISLRIRLGVIVSLVALGRSYSDQPYEMGPAAAGLRMHLAIVADTGVHAGGQLSITVAIRNTTDSAVSLSADDVYLKGDGGFDDFVQAYTSFITFPKVLPKVAQTTTGAGPKSVRVSIAPRSEHVVPWRAQSPYLKGDRYLSSSPCFPVAGYYGVRAQIILGNGHGGKVLLYSNENFVSVGASTQAPKNATATVIRVDDQTQRVLLDVGALQGVVKGDVYVVHGDRFALWSLQVVIVDDLTAVAQVTKSGGRGTPLPPLSSTATLECP